MAQLSHLLRKRTGNQPETNSKLAVNFMNKLFLIRDIIGLTLLLSLPFPPLRFRFVSKIPLHLYPESPQKLHAKMQPHRPRDTPAPRIESRIFLLLKAQGAGAANCPHHLKVANPARLVAPSLSGGMIIAPQRGPGAAPLARLWFLSS